MTTAASGLSKIKLIHTLIWVFFNVVLGYMAYAILADKLGWWLWIAIALIVAEAIVLVIFKMKCPLTLLARRYSDSEADNFDIYLPNWLAKYNKSIYTIIFLLIMFGLLMRIL